MRKIRSAMGTDQRELLEGIFQMDETYTKTKDTDKGGVRNNSTLLVFISFSMPNNLLSQYIEEAKKYNATLVLRGLIKGEEGRHSIPLTMQKIKQISDEKGANIIVHPKLFQVFNIERVPAIVKATSNIECLENGSLCNEKPFLYDKITGSVGITYALEQFENL